MKQARTFERPHPNHVRAHAPVLARRRRTVIDHRAAVSAGVARIACLASSARKVSRAHASDCACLDHVRTHATVLARRGHAVVDHRVAESASGACLAHARVCAVAKHVGAGSAQARRAFVALVAIGAAVPRCTCARVRAGSDVLCARAMIARASCTCVRVCQGIYFSIRTVAESRPSGTIPFCDVCRIEHTPSTDESTCSNQRIAVDSK